MRFESPRMVLIEHEEHKVLESDLDDHEMRFESLKDDANRTRRAQSPRERSGYLVRLPIQ